MLPLPLFAAAVFSEAAFALCPSGSPNIFIMLELADQPVFAGCPVVNWCCNPTPRLSYCVDSDLPLGLNFEVSTDLMVSLEVDEATKN